MAPRRELREFTAIAGLEALFRASSSAVELGIGDDAAVLKQRTRSRQARWVWTVDCAVEHVHFERDWLSLSDLGWRSFHAAASDVSAMGGTPLAALSSVIFPATFGSAELTQLARGQHAAARALGCQVVGGNLSRGTELSITTSLIGSAVRPLLRSGARVGDELWLCGEVGWSAAGLRLLQRGAPSRPSATERRALAAFRRPRAELAAGLALSGHARAAIDLSDGLAGDAAHLAQASSVRVSIDLVALEATLRTDLAELAATLGVAALDLALYGGEDYALLASGPARARPSCAKTIGRIEAGEGVWLVRGEQAARAARGFEHATESERRARSVKSGAARSRARRSSVR